MFKKAFIAVAVIIFVTATAGVAKMAGILPDGGADTVVVDISQRAAAMHIAAETEYEKAEVEKQSRAKISMAVEAAEKKELTPREMFETLYPKQNYNKTVKVLAKVLWGEAKGVKSKTNKACVIWCVLNRVDKKMRGDTIIECATAYAQFNYHKGMHVTNSNKKIVEDVLKRWLLEKTGVKDVGRVLPKNYVYFHGNGKYNVFRSRYAIHGSKKIRPLHSSIYIE